MEEKVKDRVQAAGTTPFGLALCRLSKQGKRILLNKTQQVVPNRLLPVISEAQLHFLSLNFPETFQHPYNQLPLLSFLVQLPTP